MYIEKLINRTTKDFDLFLKKFLGKQKNESYLRKAMSYGVLNGGKRIRPFLIIILSKFLKINKTNYMRVALAIELIHCYSLIHDDIPCMDNDSLRRGKPTTHIKFNEATAILAGNSLLTMAFEILADEKTHSSIIIRIKLIKLLSKISGADGLAKGQSLDLLFESRKFTENELTSMHYLKTARLFEFCSCAPIIMSRGSVRNMKDAVLYGKNFGLIFQAIDDLLDGVGSKKSLGKIVNKDLIKNKGNILVFKNSNQIKEYCKDLADKAVISSSLLGKNKNIFKDLIHYIINRKK